MKKYKLLKDLPGLKAGEILKTNKEHHLLIRKGALGGALYDPLELPEWFEPIPERIQLSWSTCDDDMNFRFKNKRFSEIKSYKDINKYVDLMEQAINGELYTKEDMIKFGHKCRCRNCHSIEDLMKEFITKNHGTLNKP